MRTALDVMLNIYGSTFAGPSFVAWRMVVKALFSLPMDEDERALFTQCTGRLTPTADLSILIRELWLVCGRRGGKTLFVAFVAVFLGCFRKYTLGPGERGVVQLLAADRLQGRVLMRYIVGLLESHPMTTQLIVSRTKTRIELANGIDIEITTSSFKTVRGYSCVGAVCDEIAFWENAAESANSDQDIIHALRPAMATIPNALLLCLSSPYARRGELWKAYQKHYGVDDSPVLVIQAPTRTMNPTVPQTFIDAAYEEDDAYAAAEYGAEFRRDIEAFLSKEAIADVTVNDRRELAPMAATAYTAFVDPSGGSQDSMTLAITHRHSDGVGILDCVREVRAPFSPEAVVDEFVTTLRTYRVTTVTGDAYAGEWPRERFQRRGITYQRSTRNKSEIYQAFAPLVNGGRCELLDHVVLARQLQGLERKTSRAGKDSIDHGPRGRDDVANAVAGALVLAAGQNKSHVGFARVEQFL
jgi:hypothetical protein